MKQNYLFVFFSSLPCVASALAREGGATREIALIEISMLSQQISENEYATPQHPTLKGDIYQRDIVLIRKKFMEFQNLDLTEIKILRGERIVGSGTYFPADTLADYALENMPGSQSVKLPKGFKAIGMKAFHNTALIKIEIPEGVIFLGGYTFVFCKAFKKATVPGSVKMIENYALLGCIAFEEISLGEGMTMIGGDMFNDCKNFPKIQLPSTIEDLGGQAFKGCIQFTELTIPAVCTKIGAQLLRDCPAPKTLTPLAKTAPEASLKSFYPEQYEQIEFRIPAEALESYQDSPIWSLFKMIHDLEGKPVPLSIETPHGVVTPMASWQDGYLHIAHAVGFTVAIHDITGQLLLQDTLTEVIASYPLPQGLHVIKTSYSALRTL